MHLLHLIFFWTTWTPTWVTVIRVSGLIAWYVLNVEVMVGYMASGGVARLLVTPKHKFRVHNIVSWTLLVTVLVHVSTIVLSRYKPNGTVWTLQYVTQIGWGTLARNCAVAAMYLLFAIILMCVFKKIIPRRAWIRIHHTLPFIILVLATIHGLGAGTDSRDPQIIYPAIATLTVLFAILTARRYSGYARKIKGRGKRQIQRRQFRYGRPDGIHYRKRR